jgi:hypothetical protein
MGRRSWILALTLFLILSVAALAGCGGGAAETAPVTEQEKLVDNMIWEAEKGNYDPIVELMPPGFEQFASEYAALAAEGFGRVKEIHYRTDVMDQDHVVVYFWGTFEYEQDGEVWEEVIGEDEASPIPLKRVGGTWYLDLGAPPEDTGVEDTGL